MEFKGTKDKWVADNGVVFADDYFQTHIAVIPDTFDKETREANKQVITCAPELLEMVKEFDKMVRFAYNEDCTLTPFPTRSLLDKSTELIKRSTDAK